MSARVKTALVLAPVFLAVLLFGGKVLFALLVAAAAALGAREYLEMVCPDASPSERVFSPLWAAAVALGFLAGPTAVPGPLLALGALAYFGAWIVGPGPTPDTLRRWGAMLGGWVFVAYFLGHAVWVRSFGVAPVVFAALVVWAGDTAAYYIGTFFGRRPLAPSVSPKKSVEGAIASIAASGLAALGAGIVLPVPHSAAVSCLLGLGINVAAQVGDLTESLLKRCAGVKDSGTLLPGHGGMLDRIDSFLLVLPLYATYLSLFGAP